MHDCKTCSFFTGPVNASCPYFAEKDGVCSTHSQIPSPPVKEAKYETVIHIYGDRAYKKIVEIKFVAIKRRKFLIRRKNVVH